jgi:hypothetical protein
MHFPAPRSEMQSIYRGNVSALIVILMEGLQAADCAQNLHIGKRKIEGNTDPVWCKICK